MTRNVTVTQYISWPQFVQTMRAVNSGAPTTTTAQGSLDMQLHVRCYFKTVACKDDIINRTNARLYLKELI